MQKLTSISESQINFDEIPATTEKDWVGAVRGAVVPPLKQSNELDLLEVDVMSWLSHQNREIKIRISTMIRQVMALQNVEIA